MVGKDGEDVGELRRIGINGDGGVDEFVGDHGWGGGNLGGDVY